MNATEVLMLAKNFGLEVEDKIEFNEMGLDFQVAFVSEKNGTRWILRIPRSNNLMTKMNYEKNALNFLQHKLNVGIPDWKICEKELIAYPLMKDPPVLTFDATTYEVEWNINREKNNLTESLAQFLFDLHRVDMNEASSSTLPLYLLVTLQFTPFQIGLIDGVYQGAAVLVKVISGIVADRYRKPKEVATAGYFFSAICKLGYLLVGSSWGAISGVVLFDRIGKGIRTAPRDAMIAATSEPTRLATAFGIHRALDTAGAMLGPLVAVAILLIAPGAYDAVFVVSLCIAAIGVAVIGLFPQAIKRWFRTGWESQKPGFFPNSLGWPPIGNHEAKRVWLTKKSLDDLNKGYRMNETSVSLRCQCGKFKASLWVSPKHKGFHVYCYCRDCQNFQKLLAAEQNRLDANGGTELYQTRPSFYKIIDGGDQIRCFSHTSKGLYRWYTDCCRSHIGNTMSRASVPFIGIPVSLMDLKGESSTEVLGKIEMKAFAKDAKPQKPSDAHKTFPKSYIPKILYFMAKGFIKGLNRPHPFFREDGTTVSEVKVGRLSIN